MASLPNPKRVTYEEWLEMPEVQDAIEEVVDGEIILMPPAKALHALIVANLVDSLRSQLDPADYVLLTGSFGLVISERPLTCRTPDLAVFPRGSYRTKDGYFRSAPEVTVEVISPSETRRMIERKLADFESIATPEVWIVTPKSRTVEVFVLENGALERAAISHGGVLRSRVFPNVEIEVERIWPE